MEIAKKLKVESGNPPACPSGRRAGEAGWKVDVAAPGFINFKLSEGMLEERLGDILKAGVEYGDLEIGKGRKVNVEFVSANPTGPLHIGNFRGGPLGDVIASVLSKAGFDVTREYYHNDVGGQVRCLGASLEYWVRKAAGEEVECPEGGYEGEYVRRLSEKLKASEAESRACREIESEKLNAEKLGELAVEHYLKEALEICKKAGIKYDVVSRESEIAKSGKTEEALGILQERGFLEEKEGATWFAKDDANLEDRECVVITGGARYISFAVIKSDGEYTYFSNDIGYHLDKHRRGFEKAIDIWGSNHHGHVKRMKSAMEALSFGADWLEVSLYQWVSILRSGKQVSMSKRKGDFVTAREVLDEVGSDALRWFFVSYDNNTHIKFDLDLAKEQSRKNPVYYAQYAHARIASVLGKAGGEKVKSEKWKVNNFSPEERSLIRELMYFPELVEELSQSLAVHKLTLYATALADKFHKFYETCRVLGDPKEAERLAVLRATQVVLSNTLSLLGISSPEKM
jgi:arginyl-tRNA synthetase